MCLILFGQRWSSFSDFGESGRGEDFLEKDGWVVGRTNLGVKFIEGDRNGDLSLAPAPYRGKPNESAYLPFTLRKIAALVGRAEADVATIITRTTKELFCLKG
jgi:hypothetical protein